MQRSLNELQRENKRLQIYSKAAESEASSASEAVLRSRDLERQVADLQAELKAKVCQQSRADLQGLHLSDCHNVQGPLLHIKLTVIFPQIFLSRRWILSVALCMQTDRNMHLEESTSNVEAIRQEADQQKQQMEALIDKLQADLSSLQVTQDVQLITPSKNHMIHNPPGVVTIAMKMKSIIDHMHTLERWLPMMKTFGNVCDCCRWSMKGCKASCLNYGSRKKW
jgi:hypothetical protein